MDASTALKKAQALASRSLGSSDRRRYVQHLLTLPTYRSQTLNEYYAKSIVRDFSEFEEYQDQAVDAILDLCEDENEQTRISGIKALAEIGKVEPKWVRGNTGVLVQLLECPPTELVHVKKALFDLLEVSPSDVFSMMAEDVKSSEEESGINILNFLWKDAISQRKEILESGRYIESEHIFSNGFYEVLPTSKEGGLILELLGTLSTISGRNASRESIGRYTKALTNYTTSSTAIKMWDSFTKKADPDPRWTIYFLAEHGGSVVKAAIGDDKIAKGILEFYNKESQSRWRRVMEDRDEKDLEIKTLLPRFATTMIEAAISHQNTPNTQILELTVHCIYTISTIPRHFRDFIPKNLVRKLQDFGDFANRKKKDSRGIRNEDGWRGVRDMIDTLWDDRLRVEDFKSIWREGVKASLPPASKPEDRPITLPSRQVDSNRQIHHGRPQAPVAARPRPVESLPPSGPSRPVAPSPAPRRVEPVPRPATPPSPPAIITKAESPIPAPVKELNIKSKATSPTIKPSTTVSSVAPTPQASTSNLNIRARATTSIPTKQEIPAIPAPPAVPQGLSIRSASSTPIPRPEAPTKAPSLLSRLTPSMTPTTPSTSTPTTTTKRARAEDFTPNTPSQGEPSRRSLVDRLGGSDKKQRVSSNPEIGGTPSLLSRMSQQGQTSVHSSPKVSSQPNQGFTINRTAQPQPPSTSGNGLSSKRSGLPTKPAAQSPGSGGFSIKNRSTSSTSTPTTQSPIQNQFRIKRTEIEIKPKIEVQPQIDDDAPIIRKGRGFAARNFGGVELLITPPNPPKPPFNGERLQDRFGFQKR